MVDNKEGALEEIIPTGIEELDSLLGGGLLEDSTLLVVYETHSFGWALGVEVFRRLLRRGCFGVVINYSLPPLLLDRYGRAIRYNIFKDGFEGRLGVIDVFGSAYRVRVNYPFVYYLSSVDSTSFLDKSISVYRKVLQIAGNRRPVGLTIALNGMIDLFGEEAATKILRRNIAMKMKAREEERGRPRPINIFLLNRGRVSPGFIAWLSQYMEHIVEFKLTEKLGVERMIVRKSLLPEFTPAEAEFRFSKGRFEIKV